MTSHPPSMECAAYMGLASGSHDVPEPLRCMGMPSGAEAIAIGGIDIDAAAGIVSRRAGDGFFRGMLIPGMDIVVSAP